MAGLLPKFARTCTIASLCALVSGCHVRHSAQQPVIFFDQVPSVGPSGAGATDLLRGHVIGAHGGQRIVLYALSGGTWWVQPLTIHPFTSIASDGSWRSSTHLGKQYAALLVGPSFSPPNQMAALPAQQGDVAALATVAPNIGAASAKHLRFSNYDWDVRQVGSDRNGSPHDYDPANASVDSLGFLHLHISRTSSGWACSEIALPRSLGYGTYAFSLADVSQLDPAAVVSLFTWDSLGTDQERREMDVVISRWGNPKGSNAQYIVQPFYRPANTYRYVAPAGLLTFLFRWDPSKITFTTLRGAGTRSGAASVAGHTFTADVPMPETESVHINLCTFDYTPVPQQQPAEVVVERFQFLP